MPELPEVETARRYAERRVLDHTVTAVACDEPLLLRNTTPQGLGRALTGSTITSVDRTGKWVRLTTDARSDALLHFGMTGSLRWYRDGAHGDADHVRFTVDGDDPGVLALHMPRKLGGVWISRSDAEREEITGVLGVDALDAGADDLRALLGSSRAGLKSALMDQDKVAGIGNLLSDELCWQIEVHPATPCTDVGDVWDDLADALARALDVGLDLGHVPTADGFLLDVRDDEDPQCPRCGAPLAQATIAGRTSRWCPREQPDPR